MRRVGLFALGLLMLPGLGLAQEGAFIRYQGPTLVLTSAGASFFANGISLGNTVASPYANLYGDAANTLALRNGGVAATPVPQTLYLYNFCDGANCATGYERVRIGWNANIFKIDQAWDGTGTQREMFIGTLFSAVRVGAALYAVTHDTYDFGYGADQWRSLFLSRSIQGSKSKALTDAAAATAYATIAVATNGWIGGELIWTATSVSGSDQLVANGSIRFWGSDTAGTPVCGINKIGTDGEGHSGGANTLVCTWTNVVATTNCALSVTCTNDLAGTQAITLYGRLNMPTTATVTFN